MSIRTSAIERLSQVATELRLVAELVEADTLAAVSLQEAGQDPMPVVNRVFGRVRDVLSGWYRLEALCKSVNLVDEHEKGVGSGV